MPSYLCPSRRSAPQLSLEGDFRQGGGSQTHRPGGLADYAVAIGDGEGYTGDGGEETAPEDSTPNGPFRVGKAGKCYGFDPDVYFEGDYTSQTNFKSIEDGLSNTLFVGEKHLVPQGFGKKQFDDNSIYNPDFHRTISRYGGPKAPLANAQDETIPPFSNFGSWHAGIVNFSVGDASVRSINNSIDPLVLRLLVVRNDGNSVSFGDL